MSISRRNSGYNSNFTYYPPPSQQSLQLDSLLLITGDAVVADYHSANAIINNSNSIRMPMPLSARTKTPSPSPAAHTNNQE